jgi:hypothetical protein
VKEKVKAEPLCYRIAKQVPSPGQWLPSGLTVTSQALLSKLLTDAAKSSTDCSQEQKALLNSQATLQHLHTPTSRMAAGTRRQQFTEL